jgi:uncharacterized lipoprotein YajG
MRRIMLVPLFLLAGCNSFGGPPATDWTRSDATPDEAAADMQACRHSAKAKLEVNQQIDQDAGADPTGQGSLVNNLSQYDSEKQYNQMIHDCMMAQGYAPAGKTTP